MTRKTIAIRALIGVAGMAFCLPAPLLAQDAGENEINQPEAALEGEETPRPDIGQLQAEVQVLRARESAYLSRLDDLEARLSALERHGLQPVERIGAEEAGALRGAYISPDPVMLSEDPTLDFFRTRDAQRSIAGALQDPVQDTGTGGVAGQEEPERRSPAPAESVVEITEQQQGRFGSRFGLDVGLGYSHFDNARISLNGFLALDAIFLGTISIDQITSDIFTFDPTLRFGVSDNLFIDGDVPFLYRTSNFRSGGAGGSASALAERTLHDQGIGDVSLGASLRLAEESAHMPDFVVSARVKFPTGRHPYGVEFVEVPNTEGNFQVPQSLATGSGVYGVSLGASVLKTLDPLVVYGNATYFHNFERHFSDIDENEGDIPGRVDLGNAFQFGAGLAFALNSRSSISMSFSQRIVERTRLTPDGLDPRDVVGSQANVSIANLGATFTLGPRLALVTNLGIGLTDDSPDMSLSVRLPYRF